MARTKKETITEQQKTKKITVHPENKSKNYIKNDYKNDVPTTETENMMAIAEPALKEELILRTYKRTRG